MALYRVSSLYSSNGSRLYRRVPEKRTGSCGIIEILCLSVSKDISFVSMPSILMVPSTGASLKSAEMREDLPAPVLPTTPT